MELWLIAAAVGVAGGLLGVHAYVATRRLARRVERMARETDSRFPPRDWSSPQND